MTQEDHVLIPNAISLAIEHHQAGRLPQASAIYRQVLVSEPNHFDALHLLGVVALQEGRPQEAIELIGSALVKNPSAHAALSNLGRAYSSANQPDRAQECYLRAVALNPVDPVTCQNLAIAYQSMGDREKALAAFRTVVELKPDSPEAHNNLASILQESGKAEDAIQHYQTALSLNPEFAEAQFNLARTFETMGRNAEALAGYQEALQLKPDLAEAHFCLGAILQMQGMLDDAIGCYESALSSNPEYVEARWALAMAKLALVFGAGDDPAVFRRDFSDALADLDRWFQGKRVDEGFKAVGSQGPFYLAYQEEDNRAVLERYGDLCARLMGAWRDTQAFTMDTPRTADGKIHIGIVSAYFRDHSVWHAIIKGWCRHLDADHFALHIFQTGKIRDTETAYAQLHSVQFVQAATGLGRLTNEILSQNLDVIIYPELGMDPMAMKLASIRLAPLQMVAWGHPETSGLPTIDYYLSAAGFEPDNAQNNYTERLIALPNLGCCYQALNVADAAFDPAMFGIDPTAPLFVCPGTPFKYAPERDWIFVEIARRLGRCQFLFFHYDQENLSEKLKQRLEVAFDEAGMYVDNFVVFLPWHPRADFYALLRRADVFLDTIGFSGFNTAMQAIECGLPIVTRAGRFMRGRFAAAILQRMDLNEFVAQTDEAYVELAIELGQDAESRRRARERIVSARDVLFDDVVPVRALEKFLADVVTARST